MLPLVTSRTKQENNAPANSVHSKLNFDIESSTQVKQNFRQQCCSKDNLKEQALLIATIASVVIGIAVGIALRGLKCTTGEIL